MGSGGEGEGGGDEEGDADEAEKVHAEGGSEAADGGAEDFADTDLFETFLCGEDREAEEADTGNKNGDGGAKTEDVLPTRFGGVGMPIVLILERIIVRALRQLCLKGLFDEREGGGGAVGPDLDVEGLDAAAQGERKYLGFDGNV